MSKKLKVAFICHRVGPYHFARFREAARFFEMTVVEASGQDKKNAWAPVSGSEGFRRITVYPAADSRDRPGLEVAKKMGEALDTVRPEVVVASGYMEAYDIGGLRWSVYNKTPSVIMYDGNSWDRPRKALREWVKRRIVGMHSAAFAAGTTAKEYLELLGMPSQRIITGAQVVDNDHFAAGAAAARSDEAAVRRKLGLPSDYFLFVARFLPFKNIPRTLEAFAAYCNAVQAEGKAKPWRLLLAGDGPDRAMILDKIAELKLEEHALHIGYKDYADLPAYYGLSGALVLPSLIEPWGLVVNEAMAAGVPILASKRCGCTADLVRDRVNGRVFDPENTAEMAECFAHIANPATDRAAMGRASTEMIQKFSAASYGEKAAQAVDLAMAAPTRRLGPLDYFVLQALPIKKAELC